VSLWDIPAQERATEVLRAAVARQEVGHAFAFTGPAGVGQEPGARALAAALNCTRPEPPCGECRTCHRIRRGAYADYWEFLPTGPVHRVADVREQWLPTAWRTAAEGRWKVLRVVDADRMNEAAANAFLKGLEEPPSATVWVLDVADPDELPDTILSRCRAVRFAPWPETQLEEEARRLGLDDPADRRLAVRASLGSPPGLRRLAAPGGLDRLRQHREMTARLRADRGYPLVAARELDSEVKAHTAALKQAAGQELDTLAELYQGEVPPAVARQARERTARREREARILVVQAALDDLLGWYRDCLLVARGGLLDAAIHADAGEALAEDAAALGPARILAATDLVMAARADLELNVQQGLTLEALFMELAALGYQ
jgi:DNA polymerase III subunit delta'